MPKLSRNEVYALVKAHSGGLDELQAKLSPLLCDDKAVTRYVSNEAAARLVRVVSALPGAETVPGLFGIVLTGYKKFLKLTGGFDGAYDASVFAWRRLGRMPIPPEWDGTPSALRRYHQSWLYGQKDKRLSGEWIALFYEWRASRRETAAEPRAALPGAVLELLSKGVRSLGD